jgi:hypothetical protein
MQRLRTIARFIRILVGLFVLAQFAGAVSSPFASAWAFDRGVATHVHHHHAGAGEVGGMAHEHDGQQQNHADYCCALHAFFAGVLPSVAAVESMTLTGQRVAANLSHAGIGLAPGRLDRPPKTSAVI